MGNSAKIEVPMRQKVGRDGEPFFMGNIELDINVLDTVVFFFPPRGDNDRAVLVIEPKRERKEGNGNDGNGREMMVTTTTKE